MRSGIHPNYRRVLYVDASTGDEWIGYSAMRSEETREVEGGELPVLRLDISAHSHPFWTGQSRTVDTEGRIDRFKRRYARKGG
jgi:large subunit ribosomal protein L31